MRLGVVVCCLSLACCSVTHLLPVVFDVKLRAAPDLHKGDPPRPVIPEEFSSSVIISSAYSYGIGVMHYDLAGLRYNMTITQQVVIGNYTLQLREIATKDLYYLIINDRCQPYSGAKFGDLFSWVKVASYKGSRTLPSMYENRTCDEWEYVVPQSVNLSVCVQQNNPVLLTITSYTESAANSEQFYFGKDFTPGIPSPDLFVLPYDCSHPEPLCDGGKVTELDVFIFHPKNQFDLNNENVADLLGDTVFICADSISNHTSADHYEWVSRYTLQVWSAWGQYAECNRPTPNATGVCVGTETFSVGREAAFGVKEMCGQCVDNSDVGTWFSLPTAGQCNSTTQPLGSDASKGECSWRILQRVKTIDGKCLLLANGMEAACIQERTYPFTKTQQIMLQSFESSDPSKGGCPPVA